jgi:hypothetical protein
VDIQARHNPVFSGPAPAAKNQAAPKNLLFHKIKKPTPLKKTEVISIKAVLRFARENLIPMDMIP